MPPVIAAVAAGWSAYTAIAGVSVIGAWAAAAVVAAGTYQAFTGIDTGTQSAIGGSIGSKQANGINLNSASNTEPIPVIYGSRRLGGVPVLRHVTDYSNQALHLVFILGEGPIEAINSVYFNDNEVIVGEEIQQQVVFKFNGLIDRFVTLELRVVDDAKVGGEYTDNLDKIGPLYRKDGGYFRAINQEKDGWLNANVVINPFNKNDLDEGDNLQVRLTDRSKGSQIEFLQYPKKRNGWVLRVRLHDRIPHDPGINDFEFTITRNNKTVDRSYSTASEVWPILGNQDLGNAFSKSDEAVLSRMEKNLPGIWDSTKRLPNCAALYVVLDYDPEVFSNGLPIISANIKGRKVYDPRSGVTTWSDNPVLCLRDFYTNPIYGRGVPGSDIDDNIVMVSANFCDEKLPENNEKRYTCNGVIDINNTHMVSINQLLTSFRGMSIYSAGKWQFIVERDEPLINFEFNDDNIIGDIQTVTPSTATLFNEIEARFFNPGENWQDDMEIVFSNKLRNLDNGQVLKKSIELPFTSSRWRANNIATINLNQSRHSLAAEFTANFSAQNVIVGDIVTITNHTNGWNKKPFRVVNLVLKPSGDVSVSAREHEPSVYDYGTINPDPVHPDSDLPDFRNLPKPSYIVVESGTEHLLKHTDGTITTQIYVAFGGVPYVSKYEIQYKESNGGPWVSIETRDNEVLIQNVVDGNTYDIRVRGVAGSGDSGEWIHKEYYKVIGKTELIGTPGNFKAVIDPSQGVSLSFDEVSDLDVSAYVLYIGQYFSLAKQIDKIQGTFYLWNTPLVGEQTFWCTARDTTNHKSVEASFTLTINKPSKPKVKTSFAGSEALIDITPSRSDFDIKDYSVLYNGELISKSKSLRHKVLVDWAGDHSVAVIATDIIGNNSDETVLSIPVRLPAMPVPTLKYTTTSAVLTWADCATDIPIATYKIYKRDAFLKSDNATQFQTVVDWVGSEIIEVEAVDLSGLVSKRAKISISPSKPLAPTVTHKFKDTNVVFTVSPRPGDLSVKQTIMRHKDDVVAIITTDSFPLVIDWIGTRTFEFTSFDIAGNKGAPVNETVNPGTIETPDVNIRYEYGALILNWKSVKSTLPIDDYIVRSFDPVTGSKDNEERLKSTISSWPVSWKGSKKFSVTAVDKVGNKSKPRMLTAMPLPPSMPVLKTKVQDNNVELRYEAVEGDLPIKKYIVKSGKYFKTAEIKGNKSGDATFSTWYESSKGLYTYWVVAVDIAGNVSKPASDVINVSQPPGHELIAKFDEREQGWTGTKTNCIVMDNKLIISANLNETWGSYSNNGYPTMRNEIRAGFPAFLHPNPIVASYEKIIDYGTTLDSCLINIFFSPFDKIGTTSNTFFISYSKDGVKWADGEVNKNQIFAVDFRYFKMRFDFRLPGGNDLIILDTIKVTLDKKLITKSGRAQAFKNDIGGTKVKFNFPFIDVRTISLTAEGTSATQNNFSFIDSVNPQHFLARFYDSQGNRVDTPFSWTATGY